MRGPALLGSRYDGPMSETELQQGQDIVENRFREELRERGRPEPSFEWGREVQDVHYPVRVTLEGKPHVYRFPRRPLKNHDTAALSRLVREFVESIARRSG